MMPDEVLLLYDYNAWANRRMLEACAALTNGQFTKPLGSSFSSVRDTLAHIMEVEWLWLERWRGRSHPGITGPEKYPNLASMRSRWAQVEQELVGFVRGLTPADLQRVISYRNTKGTPYSNPLWEMLQHLVNHGTYHRGQVTTLLRQLGAQAVSTDLIGFYRERAGLPLS